MLSSMRPICLFLLLMSCTSRKESEQALFYDDGSAKPVIAMTPVIDHSSHNLPWNLAEEFTSNLRYKLLQKEKLLLSPSQKKQEQKIKEYDPFGDDLSWIKTLYPQRDFIVFVEVMKHQETPLFQEEASELQIKVRLRIVDIKEVKPCVVLEEIFNRTQYIPKHFAQRQSPQATWGHEFYGLTPLGLAHAKISSEVVSRVEEYILQH